MGTTSTPNLNLIKPNPFEEEDAWGQILNTNWDKVDVLGSVSAKAIAAVTPAADRLPYYTSGTAATVTPFTAFARTLIDDADAATMRSTLGLGSVSTLSSVNLTTNVTDILPVANGGTGGTTAAAARTALSVPAISDLAAYAPLASPSLTGTPAAPTAAVDTNTTQLATTAYVVNQGYLKSATASSTYLTSATAASTYQLALGFNPIQQGGGTSQFTNKLYIGWSASSQLRVQVDSTDFGVTWPINISGTAAAPSTANVLSATAAGTAGAVGTYALLRFITFTDAAAGTTHNGSALYYANANGGPGAGGGSPAGTWRLMGATRNAGSTESTSVWLRIS